MRLPLNESKFIESEVTFRNLRFSSEAAETRRSIVRWLALSLGVINPGESRQTAVSVLDAILHFQFSEKKDPNVEELSQYIEKNWSSINEKTLRYHLLQLKKANIVESGSGKYSLTWPDVGNRYSEQVWVDWYFDSVTKPLKERVSLVLKELNHR